MRAALLALAVACACTTPQSANAQTETERRLISNAAYLLTSAAYKRQKKLIVISADKAVLTGDENEAPVAIMQTSPCVFEMIEKNSYGFKIDFNKLSNTYEQIVEYGLRRPEVKLIFLGAFGAACDLRSTSSGVLENCRDRLRFNLSPQHFEVLAASVSYIQDNGCKDMKLPEPKPRF